jgi:hypothetical protein
MVLPAGAFLAAGAQAATPLAPAANHASDLSSPVSGLSSTGANGLSSAATTSSASSLFSNLPSALSKTPWVQSLTHQGPTLKSLVSLPNLDLLAHPATTAAGHVNPGYVAQPAPLGLSDIGVGSHTYSYTTPHFQGAVTFNTPPNATQPGATGDILTSLGAQHQGYVGSVYEFGIQLNTVVMNISIPGSDQGFFWTQNVVNWNNTGIHFVDDTFNMTSGNVTPFYIAPGTIYSGCNNNSHGVQTILDVYGGVFQCVGTTIPVSAASYPVTIQLYNNVSTNAQDRSQLTYGYRITETGTGTVYTGITDTIVFNNPTPSIPPANTPGFTVDGFAPAPAGLLRDAEIDLVGGIGGDNAVFRSLNGSVRLEYSDAASGSWKNVPSAFNFGSDTGETSTGIADYWTTSHVLEVNQGPAMLYGLWNSVPWASVASGDIHLSGSITPSYGFVFVSNTPPVKDPFANGSQPDNMSWLPTTDSGTFSTYLPPLGSPWTTQYYVQAFASGSKEKNGTPVTGSVSGYTLRLAAAPGVLNAPLYMFTNTQAAELSQSVTGSSATPYDFSDLIVNVNASFDHLNDYDFPSFELVMTQSVTAPVVIDNSYQGQDSPSGNLYIWDGAPYPPGVTGILVPAPEILGPLPNFTAQINFFGGVGDQVTNEFLQGSGGEVVLWQDTDAQVANSEVFLGSIWIGDSSRTLVNQTFVIAEDGIQDIGSFHTTISDLTVAEGVGILALSSAGGVYSGIFVEGDSMGIQSGIDFGIGAAYDPYYYFPGTIGLTVTDLDADYFSVGANISLSAGTTFNGVTAYYSSTGVSVDQSTKLTVTNFEAQDHSTGVSLNDSVTATISHGHALQYSIGVYIDDSRKIETSAITASSNSIGVYVVH